MPGGVTMPEPTRNAMGEGSALELPAAGKLALSGAFPLQRVGDPGSSNSRTQEAGGRC